MQEKSTAEICRNLGLSAGELLSAHNGREVMYNLFYRTFIMTPDDEYYRMLEDLVPDIMAMADGWGDKNASDAASALSDFISTRKKLPEEELKEYDLDNMRHYTQLFCYSNSVRTAESHYLSREKLSRQEPFDACTNIYAAYKMPKDEKYKEDADFISIEMRFMAFAASKTAEALKTDDRPMIAQLLSGQTDFLREHPGLWIPDFCGDVYAYSASKRLYMPVCMIMSAFLPNDLEFLEAH